MKLDTLVGKCLQLKWKPISDRTFNSKHKEHSGRIDVGCNYSRQSFIPKNRIVKSAGNRILVAEFLNLLNALTKGTTLYCFKGFVLKKQLS